MSCTYIYVSVHCTPLACNRSNNALLPRVEAASSSRMLFELRIVYVACVWGASACERVTLHVDEKKLTPSTASPSMVLPSSGSSSRPRAAGSARRKYYSPLSCLLTLLLLPVHFAISPTDRGDVGKKWYIGVVSKKRAKKAPVDVSAQCTVR